MSSRYWLKNQIQNRCFDWLLLLIWIGIGGILRFAFLAALPPWTDECATIAFSLGNSFLSVPLNSLINSDVLLEPLMPLPDRGIDLVMEHLMAESTHPPVYFVLANLWMKLFSTLDGLASIWAARALPALLGVASIPAMFGLGCLAFRSRLVGHIMAGMMAVSPYGIFLARDARHYTWASLLVIASLSCLIYTVTVVKRKEILPGWIGFVWVVINSLGMATHYFFSLVICAAGIVLLSQAGQDWQRSKVGWPILAKPYWRRIYGVGIGTIFGCLVWLPTFQSINGSEPTNWIYDGNPTVEWFAPIGRLGMWMASMVLLLPSAITIVPTLIVVISGLVTIVFFVSIWPSLVRGWQIQRENPDAYVAVEVLERYIISTIALSLLFTYGLGMDLTLAARFQFVYFPAIIAWLGVILAGVWESHQPNGQELASPTAKIDKGHNFVQLPSFMSRLISRLSIASLPNSQLIRENGKRLVTCIWLMGLLGGLTATGNLGYLQNHRPDILAPIIQQKSHHPIFIATTHKHHGQTGRMMGLAWKFKQLSHSNSSGSDIKFFLADREATTRTYTKAVAILQKTLSQIERPLDLWLIDFRAPIEPESQDCFPDGRGWAGEYKYKLYHCLQDASHPSSPPYR
ncbi:MAG TPA: hypothetical protein DEG17_14155 [Cyanobacteria bacterium UBA11149]|nr:hypothetical protein [Cyanobacteria bacterium UBA11367]HBE60371.1 hypothetical protein [Cyanobacteria bacterium UBA11366]HBK62739.1 hypothetical protein [Cyanobacteria bacterium UBA11166]HBR75848.1 hypothetical protein [Cyanobacteria bacterium UBA11159]HBS72385.1 hypothetical protein [Cyanobacteria bacterium UBA11153]HBW89981.1 hypothetical protein [Cyanobacteria bacterium UBA11149]HCA94460.1 hypothetical protein [Cyanobacteria bacterium UBA9226]